MQGITLAAVRAGAGSVRLCVHNVPELRWPAGVSLDLSNYWISVLFF